MKNGGQIEEIGIGKKVGWKLSFDKYSSPDGKWLGEPVLNLVNAQSKEDVYFTKVYKTDETAFKAIMEREMGQNTAEIWLKGGFVKHENYRPVRLLSEFGETEIFLIPDVGRQVTKTSINARYVNAVRNGIIESFRGNKKKNNLQMLYQAVEKGASAEKIFTDLVEDFEEKYGVSDCIYYGCVKEFSEIELNHLNEKHEIRIVRPFLLSWGNMGRVLGYSGVNAVCKKLKELAPIMEPFRKANLFSTQLTEHKDLIVSLFDKICQTQFKSEKRKAKNVGSTAASKVMHLVCPDLFMMWDSKIRAEYKKFQGDGENYYEFLLEMINLRQRFASVIKALEQRYGRRHTRIVDQYNWMKAQWSNE